jgi:hypothetical protein
MVGGAQLWLLDDFFDFLLEEFFQPLLPLVLEVLSWLDKELLLVLLQSI